MTSRDDLPFTRIRPRAEQEFQRFLEAELEVEKIEWNGESTPQEEECEGEKRCRVASGTECVQKKKCKTAVRSFSLPLAC